MGYRISVLISSYNDRALVPKKLAEIEAQTLFGKAEFLFIEAASPQRERELFEPFCRRHANCRLLTFDHRLTLYQAWNEGWKQASAPFVCYSNMDDCMHPQLLRLVEQAMREQAWDLGSVLIANQKAADMPESGQLWKPERLSRLRLVHRPGPFTVWRRDLADRCGLFDGEMRVRGDKDFWSRMLYNNMKIGLLEKLLYLYVRSDGQLSGTAAMARARAADKQRLAAKPYAPRWPWRRFPYFYWLQWRLRHFPASLCVPWPDGGDELAD